MSRRTKIALSLTLALAGLGAFLLLREEKEQKLARRIVVGSAEKL